MEFEIKEPILVIGLGGAGCKLAINAKEKLASECILISHDPKDLNSDNSKILINTNQILNPSSYLIRGISFGALDSIREKIDGYSTIVIMANLAEKSEAALEHILSQVEKEMVENA